MKNSPHSQSSDNRFDDHTLRQMAEDLLNTSASSAGRSSHPLSEADTLKLIHELQVHQIELELQNEELRLAKEQMAKVATEYAELYDFAPSGYFTLSSVGDINMLNLCGAGMLGKARAVLVNCRFGLFVSDDTKQIFNQFLDKVFKSKAKESCEVTLSNNGNLPIHIHLTGIADHNEEQCHLTAVDITERKKAEEALKESQQRLYEAHKLAHIGVWDWDAEIDRVIWSDELYKISGRDPKLPAPTYTEHSTIYTPYSWQILKTAVESSMKTNESYELELDQVRPNGDIRNVKVFGGAKFDAMGQVSGLFGTVQDITERKQAEEAIRVSEKRFSTIFRSSPDAISINSLNGGRIIDVNPAFNSLFGLSGEQVIGKTARELSLWVNPDERDRLLELIRSQGRVTGFTTRYKTASGTVGDMLVSATLCTLADEKCVLVMGRDITDIRQMEDLVQQTRQNYESFFNTIDNFLFVLDDQGNIIHTNNAVIDRLGYTQEELAGVSVLMVHPPDRREEAGRIVGEMLTGVAEFCPVPIITKSGVQIPVETRVSHGFWNGKPAIFGVTKDISQLRLSEEKFSKLFHLNPSACGLSGLDDGRYYEVNEAFYTLLGFEKDEVIGKTALELGIITSESKGAILLTADNHGSITNADADLIAKNGDIKHVLLSSENIFVQDRRFRYTVVQDMTASKLIEAILQESEEQLAETQLVTKVGSWTTDLTNFKVKWSRETYRIFEIDPDTFKASHQAFLEFVHQEDRAKVDDAFVFSFNNNSVNRIEHRVLTPGGKIKFVEEYWQITRDPQGKPIRAVGSCQDITDRKQIEEDIRIKSEELAKINAEKDRFFSIIAHDLRSPFIGFLGFTDLLVQDLDSLTQGEIQKIAAIMRSSANKLFRLLENLLEWSRMQQGLIPFNRETVKLYPIISGSMLTVMDPAKNKGIEIRYDIPEDLTLSADMNMLMTVIRNLASNAVKFTPKGGKISISAKVTSDDLVEISIKDSGIGMSSSMVDDLFGLDDKTNRKGTEGEPSTGLGLIICKDFIEKHGGKIWVESEVDKGSTFYFTLPNNNAL